MPCPPADPPESGFVSTHAPEQKMYSTVPCDKDGPLVTDRERFKRESITDVASELSNPRQKLP